MRGKEQAHHPTYLEIAGKAHKEDVISNILSFFFDSQQPHGLGSIFLEAFLVCMGEQDSYQGSPVISYREVTTAKGKRIDIVLETEEFVLIIENKINHWLHNDLNEYAAHARRQYKNKKVLLAVLSMDAQNCAPQFTNVTYTDFIRVLDERLHYGINVSGNNYQFLLNDFFQTLKNLRIKTMVNEQIRTFLVENETIVNALISEKEKLQGELNNRASQLLQMIKFRPDIKKLIWQKHILINEKIYHNGLWLKADCIVGMDGYHFHTFIQRAGQDDSTSALLNSIPYFKDNSDWNVWPIKLPFETPLEVVAEKLDKFIDVVFQASTEEA